MKSRLVLLALLLVAAACKGGAQYPPTLGHSLLNQPLPEMSHFQSLDGDALDPAGLHGRAVIVKFFASYCEPCKRTLPATERAHEQYGDAVFIGVSEDDDADTARQLVQKYGLTFPVIKDEDHVLFGRFRVGDLPKEYVADKTGTIRWIGGGDQPESDFDQAVDAANR
jgi:thiol-disulfide isomerase/thioredoxin